MENPAVKLSTRYAPPVREVADKLTQSLAARDADLVSEVCQEHGTCKLILLVYQKYYMRIKDNASLTVLLVEGEDETTAHLIPAGGGDMFYPDWGAGESFIKQAEPVLRAMGFTGENDPAESAEETSGLLSSIKRFWNTDET